MVYIVKGEPQSLKRHRTGKYGTYNPSAEKQKQFASSFDYEGEPLTDYLSMEMIFVFERPKSHAKLSNPPKYPKRKDIDNLIKFVLDALNGKLYEDDCQVVSIKATKIYGDEAQTTIIFNLCL